MSRELWWPGRVPHKIKRLRIDGVRLGSRVRPLRLIGMFDAYNSNTQPRKIGLSL